MDDLSLPDPQLTVAERRAMNKRKQVARMLRRQDREQRRLQQATARTADERCGGFWLYPGSQHRVAENNKLLLTRINEVRCAAGLDLPPYALGLDLPDYLRAK